MATFGNGRRVAIVAGVRTPFAKAGTAFKSISAIELGKLCVAELLQRTNLDGKEVQALVFGTVVPSVVEPNIAREVSLLPLLPKGVQAYTVSRACASANQAITDAADQIALGHLDVAIAGGSESLSNIPILHSQRFAETLVLASKAKSLPARIRILARLRPRDFIPITPAIAEPTTGETMGQSAEKMAKLNAISREEQDHFALRSHRLASAGTAEVRERADVGQRHSRGHELRTARGAQACVRQEIRFSDRREFLAAHRWWRVRSPHERGKGKGARLSHTRDNQIVRLRRARSRRAASSG